MRLLQVILSAILLGMMLLWPAEACAQDPDYRWVKRALRSSCDWWENCTWRTNYYWRREPVYRSIELSPVEARSWRHDWRDWQPLTYREIRDNDGYHCVGSDVSVVSPRKTTVKEAEAAGAQAWEATVQWLHGGQYMSIELAGRYRSRCGTTEAGDSAGSKAASIGNTIAEYTPGTPQRKAKLEGEDVGAFRCHIIARACRKRMDWKSREDEEERPGEWRNRKHQRR